MDNFDLKKYLVENKVTRNSRMLTEQADREAKKPKHSRMMKEDESIAGPDNVADYLDDISLEDVEVAPDIFGEVLIELFGEEDPSFKAPRGFFTTTVNKQLIKTAQAYKGGNISQTAAIEMLRKILTDPKNYKEDTNKSDMVADIEAEGRAAAETFRGDVDEKQAMELGAEVIYDKYRQLRDNETHPGKVNTLKQKTNIAYAIMMSYNDEI